MATYNKAELINTLTEEAQQILAKAESLKQLTPQQLNYKPDAKSWSVIEIVEHLNIFGRHYLPLAEKGIAKSKGGNNKSTFSSGFMGEKLTNTMKPKPNGEIPSPMGTLKKFDPAKQNLPTKNTLDEFIQQQHTLLKLLKTAHQQDLEGVRVTSTLGPIIRFKLGDTYRFMIAHIQRHLLQIEKRLKEVG